MKKGIQIVLALVILGLVYVIAMEIHTPQAFNKELKQRNAAVIERLEDIRTAERAFKKKYQYFTGSFDIEKFNIAVIDTIFSPRKLSREDIENLRYIPFTDNKTQFLLEAARIVTESKVEIPVVECRAPYKMYLDTIKYRQEVINLIDNQVHNLNQYAGLKFGSLEGGNNEAGNWGE